MSRVETLEDAGEDMAVQEPDGPAMIGRPVILMVAALPWAVLGVSSWVVRRVSPDDGSALMAVGAVGCLFLTFLAWAALVGCDD